MNQTARNLLPLWDYGWCEYERIALPACESPNELIRTYFKSNDFGQSFTGPNPPHTPEIHGPFSVSKLNESDFEIVTPTQLQEAITTIPQALGFTEPPSREQWDQVQKLVSEVSNRHTWLFKLRLTEDNPDCFHEFGFVLTIFREFVCASPNQESIERLVFGYD